MPRHLPTTAANRRVSSCIPARSGLTRSRASRWHPLVRGVPENRRRRSRYAPSRSTHCDRASVSRRDPRSTISRMCRRSRSGRRSDRRRSYRPPTSAAAHALPRRSHQTPAANRWSAHPSSPKPRPTSPARSASSSPSRVRPVVPVPPESARSRRWASAEKRLPRHRNPSSPVHPSVSHPGTPTT